MMGDDNLNNEELESLILERKPRKLVDALAPLDEAQRKRLAKCAVSILRRIKRQALDGWQPASPNDCFIEYAGHVRPVAELAVLGLCSWTDAQRVELTPWPVSNVGDCVYEVLQARRPEWIGKWVGKNLASDWPDWHVIRKLVRDGVCPRPTSDAYVIAMVRTHAGWNQQRNTLLTSYLREDRGLLEDEIWCMFDVDFGRHGVLSGAEIGSPTSSSWSAALIELSQSGEIDRGRLLAASLHALNHQMHAGNVAWFHSFHEKLAPTLDERAKCQTTYCELLASRLPVVVGFALDALKVLAQGGRLDVQRLVDSAGPVFELRPKTHPVKLVQLLRMAAKQAPQLAGVIALVATRGLGHASPDVQKACVDLIDGLVNSPDAALAEAMGRRLDSVAASQRARLETILARALAEGSAGVVEAVGGHVEEDLASLVRQAEVLPVKWRELAGVDACVQAMRTGGELQGMSFDPMAVPRLDPGAKLEPIATLDELIEGLSAAVEGLEDADTLERLLDGLSRLADQRPDDFEARTGPLLKRVTDLLDERFWVLNSTMRLRRLAGAWVRKQPTMLPDVDARTPTLLGFLSIRMMMLSLRLARGRALPLLACPTHRGGWLDPRCLVSRLLAREPQDGESNPVDLMQAILRLAPDHRAEALAMATTLQGRDGAAVRFALGGDTPAAETDVDRRWSGLWIAAARARQPDCVYEQLPGAAGHCGPDVLQPAAYSWKVVVNENWTVGERLLPVYRSPEIAEEILSVDQPTLLLHGGAGGIDTILDIRSRFSVWPANPQATFVRGAQVIVGRLNSPPSSFTPAAPFLEPLFDPDTPFSEMARLLLCVALLSKDAGARGMAIDATIALVQHGRCVGDELGPVYGKLAAVKGTVRLNRLAEALGEVARVSVLHRHAAIRAAISTLAALRSPAPDDLHHLLSPLREWLTVSGEGLAVAARPILESVTGSGKTASLARALLALAGGKVRDDVYAAALRGRIERARRWEARERT